MTCKNGLTNVKRLEYWVRKSRRLGGTFILLTSGIFGADVSVLLIFTSLKPNS